MTPRRASNDPPRYFRRWRTLNTLLTIVLMTSVVLFLNTISLHNDNIIKNNNVMIDRSHLPPNNAIVRDEATMAEDRTQLKNNIHARTNVKPDSGATTNTNNDINDAPSWNNMTFIGISSNADEITDSAIRFLIEAACGTHKIKSYILLGEEDKNKSLKKKITAMALHWHSPLSSSSSSPSSSSSNSNINNINNINLNDDSLDCSNLIRVRTAPSQYELLTMTANKNQTTNLKTLGTKYPNNPMDPTNRISKIKRAREYQRQQLRQNKILSGESLSNLHYRRSNDDDDDHHHHQHVVGVLDLDLFAYPSSVSEVVDTAVRHILPSTAEDNSSSNAATNNTTRSSGGSTSSNTKFHAICANGLQVSRGKRGYYDTFATILLPNMWLHRHSDRAMTAAREGGGGAGGVLLLEGKNVTLPSMSQRQVLQWFLMEGRKKQYDVPKMSRRRDNGDGSIVYSGSSSAEGSTEGTGENVGIINNIVPVRSCFNGFTLYRADVFFESKCRYDLYSKKDEHFMSKREMQTCEHVVFHECLRRVMMNDSGDNFRIAVKADLLTLWHLLN